ncbi:hypothetical protein SADUNF_Sadunf10G0035200 [Salix dunnii]|uniref:Uncharacterized protein n=1 Tax=Salix dunnii TaxID=1413687 RepID=A0A835JS66_9ROSI|nr:hypothetical protein SADUNF_Sadunf10G0035200 [Salix dunnii]
MCLYGCVRNNGRGREQVVLVRGGTRPTPSVLGVADVASTSRRAVALPVLSLLPARGNGFGQLACGVLMELLESKQKASHYRSSPFYRRFYQNKTHSK